MSRVTITRQFPDGDIVRVAVVVDSSYPDAVDEARATAVTAFREAIGITLTGDTEE